MKGEVADGKGAGRVRGGTGAFSKGDGGIHAGDRSCKGAKVPQSKFIFWLRLRGFAPLR
jgi:hypothetical protein